MKKFIKKIGSMVWDFVFYGSLLTIVTGVIIWATTYIIVIPPNSLLANGKTVLVIRHNRLFEKPTLPFIVSVKGINKKFSFWNKLVISKRMVGSIIFDTSYGVDLGSYNKRLHKFSVEGWKKSVVPPKPSLSAPIPFKPRKPSKQKKWNYNKANNTVNI